MSKRLVHTDIPRRIYKTTIDRINEHLKTRTKVTKKDKRIIKGDFNEFLEMLLDVYEGMGSAKAYYVNAHNMHEDPSDARGEAIMFAKKNAQEVSWPKMVIIMGDDHE